MAGLPIKKSKFFQRQIPTLLGILVLVLGLGVGIFFFSDGLGVFAPRAAPETTPKNVKVTNVTDTGFSVSFLTESATPGYIRYGTSPTEIRTRAGDDRDQLSGSIGEYTLHHVSVRELQPDTEYFFNLGTTGSEAYDNNGQAFSVTTAARAGNPPAARTIYGSVVSATGSPGEGSVVYVTVPGGGELSSLVQSSGSWAIPLSRARDTQTGGFVELSDETSISIFVQGVTTQLTSTMTATVSTGQPVATITLGENLADTGTPAATGEEPGSLTSEEEPVMQEDEVLDPQTDTSPISNNPLPLAETATGGSTISARLASPSPQASPLTTTTTSPTEENVIVDLTTTVKEVVTTSQPLIVGQAAPNVVISIEVNSETQITEEVVADEDGNFELDISRFETELEPGEHSVSYSYIDPNTGKTVTETKNFTVTAPSSTAATTNQLAQAQTSPRPFSSGNPVPVGGLVASPSPSMTPLSTRSAQVATRSSQPSTSSGIPRSGSVSTTLALMVGGAFFLLAGGWSFWASREWQKEIA